jgi:hypothetical protein
MGFSQNLANNINYAARKPVHFTEFMDFEDGDTFVVVAARNWRPDIGKPENGKQFANIPLLVGYDWGPSPITGRWPRNC